MAAKQMNSSDYAGSKIATIVTITGAGIIHRWRIVFETWADEPYAPGGFLRVLRDRRGLAMAGPHVDEILAFHVEDREG